MDFAELCSFLEKLEKNSHTTGKRAANLALLNRLLDAARASGDLYSIVRLLIPKRDVERQHYNMKENALAVVLMQALGIASESEDGLLLCNWKRTSNYAAGDFIKIAIQVISRRHSQVTSNLLVSDINSMLDHLAQTTNRKKRVDIFRELFKKANTIEIKWFMRIIFKDMKIGVGENTILDALHEDARSMMATCVDLKLVCSQLSNPSSRPFRKELVLGKVIKSQHSKRMSSIEATWTSLKHTEIIAECKFDGDRMQVHRDGAKVWFWSRNGKEHEEYTIPLGDAICKCLSSQRCVLDGELLVWDEEEDGFKARTRSLNQDAARAARKGLSTTYRVCYAVFDILYEGEHGSIMHLPLRKRREILKKVLNPDLSPQIFCTAAENSEWAMLPTSLDELSEYFWNMIEKGNEGIVVKDLNSQWVPDNRDGRWCKIKPDYVSVGNDLDLLIIGGYFGSGSRGGQIASYLLALVDEQDGSTRFISICRCGQGLTEEESLTLNNKLAPYMVKSGKGGKPPPSCGYMVSISRSECPDVWISRPEMSVVLEISSEKRVYPTKTFQAGWTFRFPRIIRIRYDKSWNEALHAQEFEEIISTAKQHGNSMLTGPQKYDQLPLLIKTSKKVGGRRHQAVLPHLQNVDVSLVEQVHSFFEGIVFYICNSGTKEETESLQIQIKRAGGITVPNFVLSVNYVIARDPKGIQFQVAVDNDRDVISVTWISACISAKQFLPISPRHFLFQSKTTKQKRQMDIDVYGDPWFEDIDADDLSQVLNGISNTDLPQQELKFDEDWSWGLFRGCHFYFHNPLRSVNSDSQLLWTLTLQRLQLEFEIQGGTVSHSLENSTSHVILCVSSQSSGINMKRLLQSFNGLQKHILLSPHISVVSHLWLEDCIKQKKKLCIKPYLLSTYSSKNPSVSIEDHKISSSKQCANELAVGVSDESTDNRRKRKSIKCWDKPLQPCQKISNVSRTSQCIKEDTFLKELCGNPLADITVKNDNCNNLNRHESATLNMDISLDGKNRKRQYISYTTSFRESYQDITSQEHGITKLNLSRIEAEPATASYDCRKPTLQDAKINTQPTTISQEHGTTKLNMKRIEAEPATVFHECVKTILHIEKIKTEPATASQEHGTTILDTKRIEPESSIEFRSRVFESGYTSRQTISQVAWESDSLQDIAQTLLGKLW